MRFKRIYGRIRPQPMKLYDVPEKTRDIYGQPSLIPVPLCTLQGTVRTLKGNEQLTVLQQWPKATHMVECRWPGAAIPPGPNNPSGSILERMYLILLDGSQLNIVNVNNVEKRNQEVILTCEEKRLV